MLTGIALLFGFRLRPIRFLRFLLLGVRLLLRCPLLLLGYLFLLVWLRVVAG